MNPLTDREKCLLGAYVHLLGGPLKALEHARTNVHRSLNAERAQAWREIAEEIRALMKGSSLN
jgi:hypothetical protein